MNSSQNAEWWVNLCMLCLETGNWKPEKVSLIQGARVQAVTPDVLRRCFQQLFCDLYHAVPYINFMNVEKTDRIYEWRQFREIWL